MTDKPDWADAIANEIGRGSSFTREFGLWTASNDTIKQFAAALRKARADGMRKASAEIAEALRLIFPDTADFLIKTYSDIADKIEKGQA